MTGAQTDKESGLAKLKIAAEKGHYLLPYARLLLAVAACGTSVRTKRGRFLKTSRGSSHTTGFTKELAKLQ